MALGDIDVRRVRFEAVAQTVFLGHDNPVRATFLQYDDAKRRDVALDFSQVTRMVLSFSDLDTPMVFDTGLEPAVMTWTSTGIVTFNLSQYAVPEGIYKAELVVYDPDHVNGQVLISLGVQKDQFSFTFDAVGSDGGLPVPVPGGGTLAQRTSAGALSALRVVYESSGTVATLDPVSGPVDQLLGINVTAASEAGVTVSVQRDGTIDNNGWAWTQGLVFLGADGTLTQTPPTTGWEVVVGFAPSATRLNIDFDEPVLLA